MVDNGNDIAIGMTSEYNIGIKKEELTLVAV